MRAWTAAIGVVWTAACDVVPPAPPGAVERVSVASSGAEARGASFFASLSSDGRFVTFSSTAGNLVSDDGDAWTDELVRDRDAQITTRVSVAGGMAGAGGNSSGSSITADGRYVVFSSSAGNFVDGDTNGKADVFVRDRLTATTTRVSIASDGTEANDASYEPGISDDGRYVVFTSLASNLVPDDHNGAEDVFLRDRLTGVTTRVSVGSGGGQAGDGDSYSPFVSADGRYVVFTSVATNLVAGDTNGADDVFLHDRQTGQTVRLSVASSGAQANGPSGAFGLGMSPDGRYVTFQSAASNLVSGDTNDAGDVFVHDRQTGLTTRVSVDSSGAQASGGDSFTPSISADGRYVAFASAARNLAPADTNEADDIFVHDRQAGTTTRVSLDADGGQANGPSAWPRLSRDGRQVVFHSSASNLVPGDTNGAADVFVVTRW